MADKSAIEWTDATWNPVVGCSIVSPGYTNCYAMKMADRLSAMSPRPDGTGNPHLLHYVKTVTRDPTDRGYDWSEPVWTGHVAQAPEHILTQPLRGKRGRKIFVNSMGDLFHESIPDEWIDRVFAVMALCPQHTFQVLTKRAARMRDYLDSIELNNRVGAEMATISDAADRAGVRHAHPGWLFERPPARPMPALPNVWLGVSTERQKEADERIPLLLQTPAAVRFISAEPLLGPIDLTRCGSHYTGSGPLHLWRAGGERQWRKQFMNPTPEIDWVIVGGESGPSARPMHPQWARDLRDQCVAAGVPFFFKQWGEWSARAIDGTKVDLRQLAPNERAAWDDGETNHVRFRRVGKKTAGRLLDGREHNEFPAAAKAQAA